MLQEGTRFFTSESVTEGHPDKVCDQISDAILDAHLAQDPMARVACETIATTGMVLVMGEITSKAKVDYNQIVRDTIARIGYKDGACGFDARTCAAFEMIKLEDMDVETVVRELGVSQNTVNNAVYRIMKKLKETVQKESELNRL